jgi:alkyl hydroperoxide reductase subunit AhpF
MPFLTEEERRELQEILEQRLVKDVEITLFVKKDCENCDEAVEMLREIRDAGKRVDFTVRDIEEEPIPEIERVPAIKIAENMTFYGVPVMNEFSSFVKGIILVSTGKSKLDKGTVENLKGKKGDIKIFVTPYCPVCLDAVELVEEFAQENPQISFEVISLMDFPELGEEYNIRGTPTIIAGDKRIDSEVPDDIMLLNMLE